MAKLSIITVTYNRAEVLKANLESVLKQEFKDFEHIIVDNMSNDGTREIVSDYIEKASYEVKYIRESDTGIYNAMNKGIKAAKGTWTHILNSDDKYYSKNSLSNVFAHNASRYDLIACSIIISFGNKKKQQLWEPKYMEKFQFYYFPHPGVLIKKTFYEKYGYYDERYKFVSDAIHNILYYRYARYKIILKPFMIMAINGATSKITYSYFKERAKVIIIFHKFPFLYKSKYILEMLPSLLVYLFIRAVHIAINWFSLYIKKIYKIFFNIFDFKPYIRQINYHGYKLFYSKDYSLVERYINDGFYEPLLCKEITRRLKNNKNPIFLDVGANVGFISLYVSSHIKNIKIYAFEPGKHQKKLLKHTLKYNNLSKKIIMSDSALSYKNGIAKFASHDVKYTPGDGFLDTGRAGEVHHYKVKTITLDTWWIKESKPKVNVIKMDTEGAEGWILKGARNLITHCRPIIFLELWPDNLKAYPYDHKTIINIFKKYNYCLMTLSGEAVNGNTIVSFLGKEETYMAEPYI